MRTFAAVVTGRDRVSNSDYNMTLEEIGSQLGVTRERVRQIEAAALAKLRRHEMPTLLKMRDLAIEMGKRRGMASGVIR